MEPSGLPESTTPFDYDPESFLCESKTFTFATFSTTILYFLVFLLSLVGNSLVLWVLVKYESLESLTNVFILNLCLSDLVFSCLLPVWIDPGIPLGLGAGRLPLQAPQHGLLHQPLQQHFLPDHHDHPPLPVCSEPSLIPACPHPPMPRAGDHSRVGGQHPVLHPRCHLPQGVSFGL